jgi:molybdopterin-biosynthesis enzyme MoeA-like protein
MQIGLVVIGDELLLGRRQDQHVPKMIEILAQRGLRLSWVRFVGDDAALLEETFRDTLERNDLVFSFGGIGATPDDLTRQCAAAAAGRDLVRHPEAAAIIEKRFGNDAYPNRILMADLPRDVSLIPNPVSQIPGFSLNDHHFLPGFPNMAWPMSEWVLDTYYGHVFVAHPPVTRTLMLFGVPESELIPSMNELLEQFGDIKLSSLPSTVTRGEIELGLRGPAAEVENAWSWLTRRLDELGVRWKAPL